MNPPKTNVKSTQIKVKKEHSIMKTRKHINNEKVGTQQQQKSGK